jgi:hypothetical protein
VKLANAHLLVGRTIVAFDPRPFDDCNAAGRKLRTSYRPVITLDNGATLTFTVDEIDSGAEYGVRTNYHPKR